MERFSATVPDRLQQAFDVDRYSHAREEIDQGFRTQERQILASVEYACRERACVLVRSPSGLSVAPVRGGEPLSPEAVSHLQVDEQKRVQADLKFLDDLLDDTMRRLREDERRAQVEIERLERQVADSAVEPLLDELRNAYADQLDVLAYLEEVREDILASVGRFRSSDPAEGDDGGGSLLDIALRKRYCVNLLVDNDELSGAPIVVVDSPSARRVQGTLEYDVHYGVTLTDHTLIKAGALHQANGGYLIVDATALLEDYTVWASLSQALSQELVRVEAPDGQRLVRTLTLDPEPIPLQVKVVLIGLPEAFYTLYDLDEDFGKFFKDQASFHTEVDRTPETERAYGRFILWSGWMKGWRC